MDISHIKQINNNHILRNFHAVNGSSDTMHYNALQCNTMQYNIFRKHTVGDFKGKSATKNIQPKDSIQ